LALCGEWFQYVASPVWIEVAHHYGKNVALETLGRILRRLEIGRDEIIIQLAVNLNLEAANFRRNSAASLVQCWEDSCRLLGQQYRPKLLSITDPDDDAWRSASELKATGEILGCGVSAANLPLVLERKTKLEPDWVTFCGCSVMRHSPETLAGMAELGDNATPTVLTGVLEGAFLVGGMKLNGRTVSSEDPADRSVLAWRKAFVALCYGHGVSPAHACIQFALSAPGVIAVRLESTYSDRVAENVRSACQSVPKNFWASMREEGLLGEFSRPS
jgi:D-threo-aldose 1-dehydrogenase